ncbi:MAG: GAF domain-containing protein [Bacteroidetes bacterium]|nr:GAF domain-containing protein [Bacteroidota bacterium]
MTKKETISSFLSKFERDLKQNNSLPEALKITCQLINKSFEGYDWVGFYFMNHQSRKLHLGPYVGDATDHTIIDFGKGICGQVALSGDTYFAADVNAESNYIACSINVKSEIVVPMYLGDKLIGQIDIDSHVSNRFQEEDEDFLKTVNALIVERFPEIEDYIKTLI